MAGRADEALLIRTLHALSQAPAPLDIQPPRASVTFGAGGAALTLLELGMALAEPGLLAAGRRWLEVAADAGLAADGFYDGSEITPESVGHVSPYHTESGLHFAQAIFARALAQPEGFDAATGRFLAATGAASRFEDLTLGSAGVLLSSSILYSVALDQSSPAMTRLRRRGDELAQQLEEQVKAHASCGAPVAGLGLPLAHGLAGQLLALLRWDAATEGPARDLVRAGLTALAVCGRRLGRGMAWPIHYHAGRLREPGNGLGASWCNGSAGLLSVWLEAWRCFGDDRFLQLAELCGWHAWDAPSAVGTVCCGLAGRGFAYLELFQATEDERWLDRAASTSERAARLVCLEGSARRPFSLYKGDLGVALLAAAVDTRGGVTLPLFSGIAGRRW